MNSIDYIDYDNYEVSPEIKEKIIETARKRKCVLSKKSPDFLKSDYIIALNSIETDINTTDYIDWDCFVIKNDKTELNSLIKAVIDNGNYVLSYASNLVLCKNRDVIFNSIKNDIFTRAFAEIDVTDDPEIFKFLVLHEWYDTYDLGYYSLTKYIDKEMLAYVIKKNTDFYDYIIKQINEKYNDYSKGDLYFERLGELFYSVLSSPPKISKFNDILNYFAETIWEEERDKHINNYANIFNKICAAVKSSQSLQEVYTSLTFLDKMQINLGRNNYEDLQSNIRNYFNMVKSGDLTSDACIKARDKISELSAKYIAICKENTKKDWINDGYRRIRSYYVLKKDNPSVRKKMIESKQKQIFSDLYKKHNSDVDAFIDSIIDKYVPKETSLHIINNMINGFLIANYSKFNKIMKPPAGWYKYKRYKEACKLITRLNCKYIKYDSPEMTNYQSIISYDEKNDSYYYSGEEINVDQFIRSYEKYLDIFERFKYDIMKEIKKIEVPEITDNDFYESKYKNNIPFTDEYYEFNYQGFNKDLSKFLINCLPEKHIEFNNILDDRNYNTIKEYLLNNNIVWSILLGLFDGGHGHRINAYDFMELICDKPLQMMDNINKLADTFGYDTSKFADTQKLIELSAYTDSKSVAILGPKIIPAIDSSYDYTDGNTKKIINIANDLIAEMSKRSKSTVPYVSGSLNEYNYSIYDPQDEEILLTGIRTDACFKVDGVDNDFLHYCALNKNGFVLNITNSAGEFMARGSGFRNGNCVYINQLRTIYDLGGEGYKGKHTSEKEEIIKTFFKACQDIVDTSNNNPKETTKIDFVLVTASYALRIGFSRIDESIKEAFDYYPMDNVSPDWDDFVKNTPNLKEIDEYQNYFSTDFAGYNLICAASSKLDHAAPSKDDLKLRIPTEPVYERIRNKIIITDKPNRDTLNKVNKIEAIYAHLYNVTYENVIVKNNDIVLTGDNWFIIYNKCTNTITRSRVMEYDEDAEIEYLAAINTLNDKQQEIDFHNIIIDTNGYKKSLIK